MEGNGNTRRQGYAPVNGLKMYYQIEGSGDPLIHIHPILGFAGLSPMPGLTARHQIISMDLQGHGRTADTPERPLSIEQFSEDVVALLRHLGIGRADFFGESYGAAVATMIAVRHPGRVRRLATYGGTFGPGEQAHDLDMLRFASAPTPDSEAFRFQRESYMKVAPRPDDWPKLWHKAVGIRWAGFSSDALRAITAPTLVAVGDHDFVRIEHALETFRAITLAELAVIPDAGHFALYSEPEKLQPVVQCFLEKQATRAPIATAEMGFQPGRTR
jgi:pimeloyl-ACP methyl ester carboxylesterase